MKKSIYDKLKDEKKVKEKDTEVKALFSQRLLAFLLDLVILTLITTIVTAFIPVSDSTRKLYDEQNQILEDYVGGNSTIEEYVNQIVDIEYDISKYTAISSIVAIVISLLYYVVYPCYNSGQTFGKKIMKIKITKITDKDLSMNDLLIRAMVNNSILVNIILVALVMLLSKDLYLSVNSLLSIIQSTILIISLLLIALSKNGQGLHDKLVKTIVVRTDVVKEDILCQNES